jgi:Domain of unknown function (DUF4440)
MNDDPTQSPSTVTRRAAPADADLTDHLRAAERERLRAFVDVDMDVLESLHADDFQLVNPGGRTLTKDEYLGGVASGAIDYVVLELVSEIAVRLYGDAAALRYQSNTEIVVSGERFVLRNWHTDVYERRDGRWQVAWSQATSIQ